MENLPVSLLDVAVLVILAVSGLFALLRGFVHEVLSMVSWIGAGLVTLWAFHPALPYVQQVINIPLVAEIVTGCAIFILVLGLMMVLIRTISSHVRESAFGPLDRSLGFLFGVLRGAVIVCIAWVILFVWFLPQEEGWPEQVETAKTRPMIEQGAALLIKVIPGEFRNETMTKVLEQAEAAKQAYNAVNTYNRLINPAPMPLDEQEATEPGYDEGTRKDMQQAIEALNGSE